MKLVMALFVLALVPASCTDDEQTPATEPGDHTVVVEEEVTLERAEPEPVAEPAELDPLILAQEDAFPNMPSAWARVSSGGTHTAGIGVDGSLWTWGSNTHGQLGDGSGGGDWYDFSGNRNVPVRVGQGYRWVDVWATGHTTMAIREDGSLWVWGASRGVVPVRLGDNNDWASLPSVGIKTDGSRWNLWSDFPTPVLANQDWVSFYADRDWIPFYNGLMPIGTDGSLWVWAGFRNEFVRVGDDYGWESMAIGWDGFTGQFVSVKTDGSLWRWNLYIDNNQTEDHIPTPVRVGEDYDWAFAAIGGTWALHIVGIRTDGSLWAWGNNEFGQLGDGTTTRRADPVRIGTDNDWAYVSIGNDEESTHTVAIKTDGSLWIWGRNHQGQLGDGTWETRLSPTRIAFDEEETADE